jgi:hypothetical protein
LPNFIVIGAQRAGTTSLYAYLSKKEVHFFDGGLDPRTDNYRKGEAWYRSHFPTAKRAHGKKAFEASPLYIFHPLVPERMSQLIPEARIIALLRDPTERALSHYFHSVRKGDEKLSLVEALQSEEGRLSSVLSSRDYKNRAFSAHSYKARGLYREQLDRYFLRFPKEQILVVNSERLFAEPQNTLERIFRFIGVGPHSQLKATAKNVGGYEVDAFPEVSEALRRFFAPHNQALYELIGEDYGWK